MRRHVRTAGFVALLLAAAALAFAPLASAGFLEDDLASLVRASPASAPRAAAEANRLADADGPLARSSLALSCRLWTRDGRWTAPAGRMLRFENLLLLLGIAACARLALRRALSPWAGMDGARAAAGACAVLVVCHPLCAAAVASIGARGDLLAAGFSAAAAALFLRGRQDRRPAETVAAGACAVLAGHASAVAWLLPPLLFVLELFSARRNRPLHVRLRTSGTTLVVFGGCVGLEALTARALGAPVLLTRALRALSDTVASQGLAHEARTIAGALGEVVLPVGGSWSRAPFLFVLASALLLLALQPALVAARSAPRLWGWLAATGSLGIVLALALGASAAATLATFPAALVACAGFAVASTALSGARRVVIPAALAATFVFLARTASASFADASAALAGFSSSLCAARAAHGGGASYLVVDPPASSAARLPLLLDPSLCSAAERGDTATVRGVGRDALLALAREPEFVEMRRDGVVLVESGNASALPAPQASGGTYAWRGDLRSPLIDVDPLERRALRAAALPTAPTAEAPRMGWRAGESGTYGATGVWIHGPDGPVALFDLSRSREWAFGPSVRRVWLEPEVGRIASAELLVDVPPIPGAIDPEFGDASWTFAVDGASLPRPIHGDLRLVLALLDLDTLRYVEEAEREPAGRPRAGRVAFAAPARTGRAARLAWSLEARCGEACIARSSGRR
ncbi:MAG TPA: hypothetical protein VGR31_16620 [Planctomycetota bacterium]|jgi:hypothetical protein|nr:hypothetical protein [Planctomycetota bacterium]